MFTVADEMQWLICIAGRFGTHSALEVFLHCWSFSAPCKKKKALPFYAVLWVWLNVNQMYA